MALTADRKLTTRAGGTSRYRSAKVAANAVIYKGAALCRNTSGYAVPAANTAGYEFLGFAEEAVDNTGGSNGDLSVKYITGVSVEMVNAASTAAVTQAHVGKVGYVSDDETVRGTPGNAVAMGIIEAIESNGKVTVFCDSELKAEEMGTFTYDHASVTATTTVKLFKVPTGKSLRVVQVDYINPTGLAEHADNHFEVAIKNGATTMASWSTDADGAGDNSIPADTFITLTNSSTDANLVAAAGDVLSLVLTEGGTATLPVGRVVVHYRYV